MNNKKWQSPLFIVGASRSGTAMLRSILMKDPNISLCGETHYFDDLRPRYQGQQLDQMSDSDLRVCTNYFRAQTDRPYGKQGNPEESWLSHEALLSYAQNLGNTSDAIFEAYCKLSAERDNANVWGEKTPRHIFRMNEILNCFPTAKIVCMIRDPRAVVASYRDWQHQGGLKGEENQDYLEAIRTDEERARKSYHILLASMMWKAAANAAFSAVKTHGVQKVRIVKYEDIVNSPEQTLKELTNWLEIDFDKRLLDIPLHNSSASKFDNNAGISTAPQSRWKTVMSDSEIHVIQHTTKKAMETVGYELITTKANWLHVCKSYLSLPGSVIRAARANKGRYKSLPEYLYRRFRALTSS